MQLPAEFQTVETRCGRENHTRPRGLSESPDGEDPNIRRTIKTQRDGHNSGVKIWSLRSVSSILSRATHSNPCNKVRGKYNSKEVFLRPLFLRLYHASFIRASVVYPCVFIIASLWYGKWLYNRLTVGWLCCGVICEGGDFYTAPTTPKNLVVEKV